MLGGTVQAYASSAVACHFTILACVHWENTLNNITRSCCSSRIGIGMNMNRTSDSKKSDKTFRLCRKKSFLNAETSIIFTWKNDRHFFFQCVNICNCRQHDYAAHLFCICENDFMLVHTHTQSARNNSISHLHFANTAKWWSA